MFVSGKKIRELEAGIQAGRSKGGQTPTSIAFKEAGDTLFFATVDLDVNSAVVAVNNVYQYTATLYYKQFSPHTDPDEYVKDVDLTQYQAATNVKLLSSWDLQPLISDEATTRVVVLPCVQRNEYFENLALAPGSIPDNSLTNDNFGQSLNLRIHTEDGIITSAWEILGFYEGVSESKVLDKVLTADTDTGVLTGSGVSNYRLLVRIDDAEGRPRIGYMRIHASDNPEYPDNVDEDCGVGDFPGTLPGDDDSGGFPGEENPTEDENTFPGIGSGEVSGDDEFPGKIDDCW